MINKNKRYFPSEIEPKWREAWKKQGVNKFKADSKKPKYYNLVELPYPSGDLHIGHWFSFVPPDVHARYKRMSGFNVLFPNGFDAFGLPAENAAIKRGVHPKDWTMKNIETMTKQFEAMGTMIDWDYTAITCLPEYYRWNQWIFLKMFEKGLAYRGKALSNWCEVDKTVLANEHIEGGKCWRCGSEVMQKEVEQWFLKITDFADELIWQTPPQADWPKMVRDGQNNWIGKSEGMLLQFPVSEEANYVLLHGFTGSSKNDFFPWVKSELIKEGHEVVVPDLPNSSDPSIEEQVEFVLKHAKFEENTILLGHSLGCAVALKVVEKLQKPIKKLVLASGFVSPGFLDHERPFEKKFDWQFDFEKIKRNVSEVILLRAKNDSAVPPRRAEEIQSLIGGKIVDFVATNDHITGKEEPVVLEYLKQSIEVFTTRPDTTDGATFLVIAPEHKFVASLLNGKWQMANGKLKEIQEYVQAAQKKTEMERKEDRTKSGVFTGKYVINPVTDKEIPVWISDYVLAGYGTGAIMAVPFADERDREFATKFNLPIIETSFKAKPKGKKWVNYHLRDWSISRQRYWGTPIPIIYCVNCWEIKNQKSKIKSIYGKDFVKINGKKHAMIQVPYEDLPVELPYNVDYAPKGKPPLATDEEWLKVKCPKCEGPALRDAETLDTFFDSAWYYYRYVSPGYHKMPFDKLKVKELLPVDVYFGGSEHTLGHTLYARFFTKFFKKIGLVEFDEFALKRVQHGVILGPDGNRMSKSKGNVVNPDDVVKEYGADAVRLYLCFMMPYEATSPWSIGAISGIYRFLKRIWEMSEKIDLSAGRQEKVGLNASDLTWMHKTIKKVGDDINTFQFNTAVASLMSWLNYLSEKGVSKEEYKTLLRLLAPFAPYLAEELYHSLRSSDNSIHLEDWPQYQSKYLIEDMVQIVVQINGKLRDTITVQNSKLKNQNDIEKMAKESEKIVKHLENKTIRKVIYIEGKLINFVV